MYWVVLVVLSLNWYDCILHIFLYIGRDGSRDQQLRSCACHGPCAPLLLACLDAIYLHSLLWFQAKNGGEA